MRLPVLVENWQQECCGEPFSIGDSVSWGFAFDAEQKPWPVPNELIIEWDATASRPPRSPVKLTAGPLTLYWSTPQEPRGELRIRGIVHEDHHAGVPEDGVRNEGIVRRIRLLDREQSLRDLDTSPRWFNYRRGEVGLLVDLEIDDS